MIDRLEGSDNVILTEPKNFMAFTALERSARKIMTDSGGVQKEAYFFGVPCITVRDETEWVETLEQGWNVLVGAHSERIVEALGMDRPFIPREDAYDGKDTSLHITEILEKEYGN